MAIWTASWYFGRTEPNSPVQGTHPKVAQELLRHTDARLTLKYSTHTSPEQLASPLASLPAMENGATPFLDKKRGGWWPAGFRTT